jgi:hypothetical protein
MSSKINIKHLGKVMNRKLYFINSRLWEQQLSMLEGKEFELIIKERHKKTTVDQHGYYRGGILGTCHQTEMFSHFDKPDDIHENYFAPKFLSYKVMVELPKEKYTITKVRSMSQLDKKETAEFIDRVLADCAENGVEILSPEEYYIEQFKTIRKDG